MRIPRSTPWLFLRCAALGGESGVDRHVDMNRFIWDNREPLCSRVQEPAHPSFCIKDVVAWWKRSAVISISVRRNARDLLFLSLAQNDQRIISIVFRREFPTVPLAKLSLSEKECLNVLQPRVAAPLLACEH